MHSLDEYDSEARWYYPALMCTTTMDPLCEKYYSISPYAWCMNNPVRLVDPDGRENVDSFDPNDPRTHKILDAKNVFPQNTNVIHVWAHGQTSYIETYNDQGSHKEYISNADGLNAFLNSKSELWMNVDDHSGMVIVLHSCWTGAGDNSIAQIISSDPNFKDVLIVAPSTSILVQNGIEYGPTQDINYQDSGCWKMFMNGEMVNSFSAKSKPIFDTPNEQVERYKQKQNGHT